LGLGWNGIWTEFGPLSNRLAQKTHLGGTLLESSNRMGQMVELCYGDAKDGRSTSCATNHCIKTYQNTSKLQTNPKQIVGYFLGFSNLGKKFFADGYKFSTCPWQPSWLLIPYVVWINPFVVPIIMDSKGFGEEHKEHDDKHEEHEWNSRIQTHTTNPI
jgi:hypothetical protein